MKFLLKIYIAVLAAATTLTGCIEDGFTTSPSDRPVFSTDTLRLGDVFTGELTPTHRFTVRNPHSKALNISSITAIGGDWLRLNVDGISGSGFSDVEIRANDSIFVFVEANLPETEGLRTDYEAKLTFTTNGVAETVVITAGGVNATRLKGRVFDADTRLEAGRPYIIYDSLVVAPDVRLTLGAGTHLCFHDKSSLIVYGSLTAEGTPESPVEMSGDRTGNVVGDISFDIMSRQWNGVYFTDSSKDNTLTGTVVRNTWDGVSIEGDGNADTPRLRMTNCRLRNSGGLVLSAVHSSVEAVGCEFAEGSHGLVFLQGGNHRFDQCTFANYYLFTVVGGPAIGMSHLSSDVDKGADDGSGLPYMEATFSNSIIYGLGPSLSHGDLTGSRVYFRTCLFKDAGSDDDNFIACLWDKDPLYYTVRDEYIFDYRLRDESPAIGAADPVLSLPGAATDFYGLERGAAPDLGAYVHVPSGK